MHAGNAPAAIRPHRVLVLGGGFAGVMTVQELEKRLGRRTDVEVWCVSRDNFMLFTPPLPEVCSGILEPRHGPTMETSAAGVFAIGNCAAIPDLGGAGGMFAPTAQNAVREARQLARNIVARIDGTELAAFRYQPLGTLASIGHRNAVGTVFGIHVRGFIAWVMSRLLLESRAGHQSQGAGRH